jgi:hypothetical protein
MKKIFLSLTCLFISTLVFSQTADEIVNKYIDALGGKSKIAQIKNIYMEGTVDAQGQQIVIKNWQIVNTCKRDEFTVMGMTGYSIVTKDSGWTFSPFQGQKTAEPMTAEQVKKEKVDLDEVFPLTTYKEKGYKLEYKGKDDVDGTDAYKLELTINDSNVETYFIDPNTYYIMRVKEKATINGKTEEGTTDFTNYQKTADGFMFPMSVGSDMGAVKFTSIKINTDMDPSLFVPKR